MQRIAITGSSGYLGRKLIEALRRQNCQRQVLGLDIKSASDDVPDQFVAADIRDPKVGDALRDFRPDTVIHSAFSFQPHRDERMMRAVNLTGCENLLRSVAAIRPKRLLVISSATAFGAWPDNPLPIPDGWPARGRPEFCYSADKAEIEKMMIEFARSHPDIAVSWVRPAIVIGPEIDNYITRFIFGMPFLVRMDGVETIIQFVHEKDVMAAILEILARDGRGGFNIGPPDWVTVTEIANASGRRCVSLPFWLCRFFATAAWFLHLPIHEYPASFLYFARYPWAVVSDRLRDEMGFQFQYNCHQTMDHYLENKKLPAKSREP